LLKKFSLGAKVRHDMVVPSVEVLVIVRALAPQILITPREAGYQLYFASSAAVPKGTVNNFLSCCPTLLTQETLKCSSKNFTFSVCKYFSFSIKAIFNETKILFQFKCSF
jgi:hypothetical protein